MSDWQPDPRILGGSIGGYGPSRERQAEMAEARNRATTDARHALSVTEARLDEALAVLVRKVASLEKQVAARAADEVRTEALTQAVSLYWRKRRRPNPDRVADAAARFVAFLNTGH